MNKLDSNGTFKCSFTLSKKLLVLILEKLRIAKERVDHPHKGKSSVESKPYPNVMDTRGKQAPSLERSSTARLRFLRLVLLLSLPSQTEVPPPEHEPPVSPCHPARCSIRSPRLTNPTLGRTFL